jgi:hypothetical protein
MSQILGPETDIMGDSVKVQPKKDYPAEYPTRTAFLVPVNQREFMFILSA